MTQTLTPEFHPRPGDEFWMLDLLSREPQLLVRVRVGVVVMTNPNPNPNPSPSPNPNSNPNPDPNPKPNQCNISYLFVEFHTLPGNLPGKRANPNPPTLTLTLTLTPTPNPNPNQASGPTSHATGSTPTCTMCSTGRSTH